MPDNQPPPLPCDLCGGENIQPNIPAWTCGTCGKTYLKGSTLAYMPVSASPVTRSQEVHEALVDLSMPTDGTPIGIKNYNKMANTIIGYIAQLERDLLVAQSAEAGLSQQLDWALEAQPKPQSDEGLPCFVSNGGAATHRHTSMVLPDGRKCEIIPSLSDDDIARLNAALSQAPVPTSGAVEVAREVVHDVLLMVQDDSPGQYWIDKCAAVIAPIIQTAIDGATQAPWVAIQSALDDLGTAMLSGDLMPIELKAVQTLQHALMARQDAALATQPPAADGKLRALLKRWVALVGQSEAPPHKAYPDAMHLQKMARVLVKESVQALAQPASGGES